MLFRSDLVGACRVFRLVDEMESAVAFGTRRGESADSAKENAEVDDDDLLREREDNGQGVNPGAHANAAQGSRGQRATPTEECGKSVRHTWIGWPSQYVLRGGGDIVSKSPRGWRMSSSRCRAWWRGRTR